MSAVSCSELETAEKVKRLPTLPVLIPLLEVLTLPVRASFTASAGYPCWDSEPSTSVSWGHADGLSCSVFRCGGGVASRLAQGPPTDDFRQTRAGLALPPAVLSAFSCSFDTLTGVIDGGEAVEVGSAIDAFAAGSIPCAGSGEGLGFSLAWWLSEGARRWCEPAGLGCCKDRRPLLTEDCSEAAAVAIESAASTGVENISRSLSDPSLLRPPVLRVVSYWEGGKVDAFFMRTSRDTDGRSVSFSSFTELELLSYPWICTDCHPGVGDKRDGKLSVSATSCDALF